MPVSIMHGFLSSRYVVFAVLEGVSCNCIQEPPPGHNCGMSGKTCEADIGGIVKMEVTYVRTNTRWKRT